MYRYYNVAIMMRRFGLLILFALVCMLTSAQVADTVSARLDYQRWIFPQEKIHVTTDKPYYTAGDTIWMRVFVIDAANHQPVHTSRFVYVELRPPGGATPDSVTLRVKLREQDGIFKGYLPLEEHLAEGDYTLAAYTMFMQSLDDAYFFKRRIPVVSPYAMQRHIDYKMKWEKREPSPKLNVTLKYSDAITGEDMSFHELQFRIDDGFVYQRFNKKGEVHFTLSGKEARGRVIKVNFDGYEKLIPIPRDDSDYEVSFYPEGGYLVPGVPCKTAFKALAVDGMPRDVTGRVIDEQNREVATVTTAHDGMGQFVFSPETGHTYTAHVSDSSGLVKSFVLPHVNQVAAIVQAEQYPSGKWRLTTAGQVPAGATIVLQQRGVMVSAASDSLIIDEGALQPGVTESLLVDADYNVLSRRLLFVKGESGGHISFIVPEHVSHRQHVETSLIFDGFNVPQGDYAVSVTDDASIVRDSTTNILTQLLLQSELKGHIGNPAYYFGDDPNSTAHLDLLMLTHGWTRYDIPQVVNGVMTEPSYPIEVGQAITGRVLSEWRKKPLAEAIVNVIAPKIGWADVATTNQDGYFSIEISSLPDSVQCVLQAFNKKGKREYRLLIDPEEFPKIEPLYTLSLLGEPAETQFTAYVSNERSRILSSGDMRNIMLSEIVVLSKRRHRDPFEVLASRSFDEVSFKRDGITNIEQALRNIPGIWISNGYIRSLRSRDQNNPTGHMIPIFVNSDFGVNPVGTTVASATAIPGPNTSIATTRTLSYATSDEPVAQPPPSSTSLFEIGNLTEAENMIGSFQDIKRIDYIPPGIAAFLSSESSLYGAIIITTKSGLDRSKSHKNLDLNFITPLGYQQPVECYNQRYDNGDDAGIALGMDQRNLLYWNPSVKIDSTGKSGFDFYVNDVVDTSYSINIEGLTDDGEIIFKRQRIVKK